MKRVSYGIAILLLISMSSGTSAAQNEAKDAKEPAKPPLSTLARLQAATTAYLQNVEGSGIGADTVETTLEGWGRYKLVDSPKDADLIIQVYSPEEGGGGVSVSSTSGASRTTGRYEDSTSSSREISSGSGMMRLVVRDAKTKLPLFSATQSVKGGVKKNARENNLVDAAQKLVAKFHDRVEPVDARPRP